MIRHIFIAPINEGVTEEKVNERVNAMRLLSESVPEIVQLTVGKNLGLYGTDNAITLVVDFKDRAGWDAFMTNSYHLQLYTTASEVLDLSAATAAQIEF